MDSKFYITQAKYKNADGTEKIIQVKRSYKVKRGPDKNEIKKNVCDAFANGSTKTEIGKQYNLSAYKVRTYLK